MEYESKYSTVDGGFIHEPSSQGFRTIWLLSSSMNKYPAQGFMEDTIFPFMKALHEPSWRINRTVDGGFMMKANIVWFHPP